MSELAEASRAGTRLFAMIDDANWRAVAEIFDYAAGGPDVCLADIGWDGATTHPMHRLEGPWKRAPHPLASAGAGDRRAWISAAGAFVAEDFPDGPNTAELDAWLEAKAAEPLLARWRCAEVAADGGHDVLP